MYSTFSQDSQNGFSGMDSIQSKRNSIKVITLAAVLIGVLSSSITHSIEGSSRTPTSIPTRLTEADIVDKPLSPLAKNQVRFKASRDIRCPGGEFSGDIKIALLDENLKINGKLKPLDSRGELLLNFPDATKSVSYSIYQKSTINGIASLSHITYLDMPLGHTYKAGVLTRTNTCDCPVFTVQHPSVSAHDFSSFYGVIGTPLKDQNNEDKNKSRYQLKICGDHALMSTHLMNTGSAAVVNAGLIRINRSKLNHEKVNNLKLEKLSREAVNISSNKSMSNISVSSLNAYHKLDAPIFTHRKVIKKTSPGGIPINLDIASENSRIWQLSATGREPCPQVNGCQWSVRHWKNIGQRIKDVEELNFPSSFSLLHVAYSAKTQRIDWTLNDKSLNAYSKQMFTIIKGIDRVSGEIYAPLTRSGYPIPEIMGYTGDNLINFHQFDLVGYDTMNNYQALVLDASYSISDNKPFNQVNFEYRYNFDMNGPTQ